MQLLTFLKFIFNSDLAIQVLHNIDFVYSHCYLDKYFVMYQFVLKEFINFINLMALCWRTF